MTAIESTDQHTLPENCHLTANQRKPIQTAGEVCSDGAIIELVRNTEDDGLSLLLYDGNPLIASQVTRLEKVYEPVPIDSARGLILPAACSSYGATTDLFSALHNLLASYEFPKEIALPVTYFVIATWFTDCLDISPCLVVTGARSEAMFLLRLLSRLVRHAWPIVHLDAAHLRSLPMLLQPTLVISQKIAGSSPLARRIAAASHRGFYLHSKSGLVSAYSAKVIYSDMTVDCGSFGDGALQVDLPPCPTRLPILDEQRASEIERKFQPMLLMFRLRNLSQVRVSSFDLPEFATGPRMLANTLGRCIVEAPQLQHRLREVLKGQNEACRMQRWHDLRCITLEALLAACHGAEKDKAYVGELTKDVNIILCGRGESREVVANQVGDVLTCLGLARTRDRDGFSIPLTSDARRRIHDLARAHSIATVEEGVLNCSDCVGTLGPESASATDEPGVPDAPNFQQK